MAPRKRGLIFLTLFLTITFLSCGTTLKTWRKDTYQVSYDPAIFKVEQVSGAELSLILSGVEDSPQVSIIAIYPVQFPEDEPRAKFLEQAEYVFKSKFNQVMNSIPADSEVAGVSEKRLSVSGKTSSFDGMTLGLMRILISKDTILEVDVLGETEKVKAHIMPINDLLDSAKIVYGENGK